MKQDRGAGRELTRLPKKFVDRLAKPFARFLRIEATGGGILLLATIVALAG